MPRNFPLLQVVFISFLELTLTRNYLGLFASSLNRPSVIYSIASYDIQFAKNSPPSFVKMRLLDSLLYNKKSLLAQSCRILTCERRRISGCHLVPPKNNVCEPEQGNDFCDVMTFVSPWPIRFHDRMKLECSSQRIPRVESRSSSGAIWAKLWLA